jgi:hypothetical protein
MVLKETPVILAVARIEQPSQRQRITALFFGELFHAINLP